MSPETNWFLPVTSAMLGYWLIEIAIRIRNARTSLAASNYSQEIFGVHRGSYFTERTQFAPAYAIWDWPGCLFIGIDGPSGLPGYVRFVAGFEDDSTLNVNRHSGIVANDIYTRIVQDFDETRNEILIHGHSQGASIALALAGRLRNRYPDARIRVVTYGAPRILRGAQINFYRSIDVMRWMGHDDPVPLVPPASTTPIISVAQIGLPGLRQYSTWEHVGYTGLLASDGTIRALYQPEIDPNVVPAALAAWLYSMATRQLSGHSAETYSERLLLAAREGQGHGAMPPAGELEAAKKRLSAQQMRDAVRRSEAAIRDNETLQLQTPTVIPNPFRWRSERIGIVWNVYWGSYLVCSSLRRRDAGAVVKWGNRWQHSLQRKPIVERAAMLEALQTYLDGASDPASGFAPVMKLGS